MPIYEVYAGMGWEKNDKGEELDRPYGPYVFVGMISGETPQVAAGKVRSGGRPFKLYDAATGVAVVRG